MAINIRDWMKYPEDSHIWLLEAGEAVVNSNHIRILESDINKLYVDAMYMGPGSTYEARAGFAEQVREIQKYIMKLKENMQHEK